MVLHNCLQSVDLSTTAIRTTSGLAFTSRIPVKHLHINLYNRKMTEDEATAILEFSSVCPSLGQLCFAGSVPPQSFKVDFTLTKLKSRNVAVKWGMFTEDPVYILNLETGRWQRQEDGGEPTEADFDRMRSKFYTILNSPAATEDFYKGDIKRIRENLRKEAEERRTNNRK